VPSAAPPAKKQNGQPAGTSKGKQNGKQAPTATGGDDDIEDEEFWGEDDSIFDNEALMAATESASAQAPPQDAAGSEVVQEARTAESLIHDLTGDNDGTADNTAEAFQSFSSTQKGKKRETTDIPEDMYDSRQFAKGPWTYWSPEGTIPVLEEQPKWFVLREILEEIENQIHWSPVNYNESIDEPVNDTILIMCNSVRTVITLRKYLASIPELNREAGEGEMPSSRGGKDLMLARAAEYFLWKGSMGKMSKGIKAASNTTLAGIVYEQNKAQEALHAGPSARTGFQAQTGVKDNNYESAALKRKSAYKHGQPINKRRRMRGGGTFNPNDRSAKVKPPGGLSTDILEREAAELADSAAHDATAGEDGALSALPPALQEPDDDFDPIAFNEYFGLLQTEQTVIIRAYAGDEDDRVLEELRPKYVIIYDPEPAFVRRLEVGHAAFFSGYLVPY
jgi:DNA excision repair protein ERCC-4